MAEDGRCRMGGISKIVAMITPGVAMRVARGRQQQANCPGDCQAFVVICLFGANGAIRQLPTMPAHASCPCLAGKVSRVLSGWGFAILIAGTQSQGMSRSSGGLARVHKGFAAGFRNQGFAVLQVSREGTRMSLKS